jgi:hypothetical protein
MRVTKRIPKRKNTIGEIPLHNFKIFYFATVIKTVGLWKDQCKDEWNRTEIQK